MLNKLDMDGWVCGCIALLAIAILKSIRQKKDLGSHERMDTNRRIWTQFTKMIAILNCKSF